MTHPSPAVARLGTSRAIMVLAALLPLLAVFSAMAMTPALLLLAVVMAQGVGRAGVVCALTPQGKVMTALVVAMIAWSLLSATWSITPGFSAITAVRVIVLMIFGAAAFGLVRARVWLTAQAFIPFAAALAFCAVVLLTELLPSGGVIGALYDALGLDFPRFIDKNVNRGLCALTVLVWPASLGLRAAGHARLALLLPWLMAAPVFAMDSLSAKVGMAVGLIAVHALPLLPKIFPRVLAVAVVAVVASWPVMFKALDGPVFSNPEIYDALPDTAQHRVEIWRFALERVGERPWLGWGMETSRAIPDGDVVYSGERKYMPLHPHNSAMQIVLELGAVGFTLACAALTATLAAWVRLPNLDTPARASSAALIVSYLAIGFSAFGVWQYWWIALGWLAAVLWRLTIWPASSRSATQS